MVVFRELPGGRAKGNAQMALAAVDARGDKPTLSALGCARVYFAASRGICVAPSKRFATGWRAEIFGADLRVQRTVELAGLPSRTRVSPDGRYGTVTMFVAGHSYAAAGAFSTQTTLIDLEAGRKIANMEDFTVTRNGRQVTAIDVNYWGVTFARDSDRFYATLATGGKTYLIRGSVSDRTAEVIKENVECPSLSPDGTRVAFKKRTGSDARPWHLTVLDLNTMQETPLAEQRSIDDQAEWLDDGTVLYGLEGAVWSVPADGSGEPSRFLAGADSPAVVRW
jgi:dipeptidyl aminopeptidase/acylaminoacyl peptidase